MNVVGAICEMAVIKKIWNDYSSVTWGWIHGDQDSALESGDLWPQIVVGRGGSSIRAIGATHCRILPLDRLICLWMSLSNQATVRQKLCVKWPHPFYGRFGAKWKSPQTSLIDSHVKSIFLFSQNRALNAFSMVSGRARPSMLSSCVIGRIRASYGFCQGIFCQNG